MIALRLRTERLTSGLYTSFIEKSCTPTCHARGCGHANRQIAADAQPAKENQEAAPPTPSLNSCQLKTTAELSKKQTVAFKRRQSKYRGHQLLQRPIETEFGDRLFMQLWVTERFQGCKLWLLHILCTETRTFEAWWQHCWDYAAADCECACGLCLCAVHHCPSRDCHLQRAGCKRNPRWLTMALVASSHDVALRLAPGRWLF